MQKLVYEQFGQPSKVLSLQKITLPTKLLNEQVLVKWLKCPINPSDLNQIEGNYPSKPELPATPGNEGVGIVLNSSSDYFKSDELVVPKHTMLGTWRSHSVHPSGDLIKIDSRLNLDLAASIKVNPCTAYNLLSGLPRGTTICQNAANSNLGINIVQIAKRMGIRTINVMRRHEENWKERSEFLNLCGADYILSDEELKESSSRDLFNGTKPSVFINSVGGESALSIAKLLRDSKIVTVGAMSKRPLTIPASFLIFNNLTYTGYWHTAFMKDKDDLQLKIISTLTEWMLDPSWKVPKHTEYSISDYRHALEASGKKFFIFNS